MWEVVGVVDGGRRAKRRVGQGGLSVRLARALAGGRWRRAGKEGPSPSPEQAQPKPTARFPTVEPAAAPRRLSSSALWPSLSRALVAHGSWLLGSSLLAPRSQLPSVLNPSE